MPLPRREITTDAAPNERPTYVAPPPRELRRERKALLGAREERLRDLGGLALEMYKRDRFVASLVVERCAELVAIEARIHEIDALLDGTTGLKGGAVCVCGAPLLLGARFCATCGRQVAGVAPDERPPHAAVE
ncbi:MAG TPA: hypothetical protein VMN35_06250 [Gaiellaceae bacterium]|nr:hypothetical protein [Gaiellaceae bacterium]